MDRHKIVFVNRKRAECGCIVEYDSGRGEYSEVITVRLCASHSIENEVT